MSSEIPQPSIRQAPASKPQEARICFPARFAGAVDQIALRVGDGAASKTEEAQCQGGAEGLLHGRSVRLSGLLTRRTMPSRSAGGAEVLQVKYFRALHDRFQCSRFAETRSDRAHRFR